MVPSKNDVSLLATVNNNNEDDVSKIEQTNTNDTVLFSQAFAKKNIPTVVKKMELNDGYGGRRRTVDDDNYNSIEWKLASATSTTINDRCTTRSFSSSSSSSFLLENNNPFEEYDGNEDESSVDSSDSDDSNVPEYTEQYYSSNETYKQKVDIDNDKNILVNFHDLKKTIENFVSCKQCIQKGRKTANPVKLIETTIGIATTLTISCTECHRHKNIIPSNNIVLPEQETDLKKYAIHYNVILCSMRTGFGLSALGNIFASLGLKCSSLLGRVHGIQWRDLEKEVGTIVRNVTKKILDTNFDNEVEATLINNPECEIHPDHGVGLTVSSDAGWQKRSSGNRFDSQSCHCLVIGQATHKVIDYEVYCKQCKGCTKKEKKQKTVVQTINIAETNHLLEVDDMMTSHNVDNGESQNLLFEEDAADEHFGETQFSQSQVILETQQSNVSSLVEPDNDDSIHFSNNKGMNELLHTNVTQSDPLSSNVVPETNVIVPENKRKRIPSHLDKDYKIKEISRCEPPHPGCCRNFEGTSKSMEVVGNTKLVWRIYHHKGKQKAYVHGLVTDDDTTTRAALKHSYNDYLFMGIWKIEDKARLWPRSGKSRAYKSDLGRIPLSMQPPQVYYADPSHRKKVFAGQLFKLAADPSNGICKWEAEVLKIYFGYAQAQYNGEDPETFRTRFTACLEHIHNVHDNCDSSWCLFKNNTEKIETEGVVKFKEMGTEDYKLLKEVFDHYTSESLLAMINHKFSTQKNEAMNKCISKCAPKNQHFSKSMNLHSRVAFAIGSNSEGYVDFATLLYKEFKIKLNSVFFRSLSAMENDRLYYLEYKSRKSTKAKRIKAYRDKLRKQLEEHRLAKRDNLEYKSGVAVQMNQKPKATKARKSMLCPNCNETTHSSSSDPLCIHFVPIQCPTCKQTDHRTKRHRFCPFYIPKITK